MSLQLNTSNVQWWSAWLGLFTSFGTLICCALPSLFVVLGMGATLVSLLGEFPQLIWLSENKNWLFASSFIMLTMTFFIRRWTNNQPCPIEQRLACEKTKKWSGIVYWSAVAINLFGVFFTFVLPPLLYGF